MERRGQTSESISCTGRRPAGCSQPLRAGPRKGDARENATRRAVPDLFESCARVAHATHLPTRGGILGFFGDQVLVNGLGWTAGVMAAALVRRFFEVRGLRNLWGLTAAHGRTPVSADHYQLIITLVSYSVGLVMLILVRHLVLRWISELYLLRFERVRAERASRAATAEPKRSA